MASLSYLLCWEYSPLAACSCYTMVILFRASHGRADWFPLTSPGLTKITPNITHIAMDGLSSQHRSGLAVFVVCVQSYKTWTLAIFVRVSMSDMFSFDFNRFSH
jgi:hypothetical protein